VIAELRSYLVVLDPGVSPAQSAATALTQLVTRLRQTTATELCFTAEHSAGDGWPAAAVLDVLQAAREGVSNALRHGQATQVQLALHEAAGQVLFTIVDNGKGFNPSAVRSDEGHGLGNLERRAKAWNGSLHVESRLGGPTRLTLALLPFGATAPESDTAMTRPRS
jgi:signal transduction histidine kinase